MAGAFLMSICSIFGFLLLLQHAVLGTIIQTLLWIQNYSFVCKLFFSQCSLLNTSVLHKCNFASLRWGGRKEKQIVRQKKPFHWSEGILLQMHTLQSKCTNKFKHLAVYLMKRWGTACSRVHMLAAEGLHAAAVLASEQGCAAPALPAAR